MNATPPLPPLPPAGPPPATGMAALPDGLRFAVGALTAWQPAGRRVDRPAATAGMRLAPLVGLALGALAGGLCWVLLELEAGWLLTAVLTVALLALLTRGLPLEGLAGFADALASRRSPAEALAVARGPGLGRSGGLALLFAVLVQVAAVHELAGHGRDYAAGAVLVAVVTARAGVAWACREVPAAEGDGFGALVARAVPTSVALPLAALTALFAGGVGSLAAGEPGAGAVIGVATVALGLSAAELVLWQARARLGGLTEGVLGAVSETVTAVALVTLVVGAT
ncbi:adenosylcobinamide-GDP ribazoletransferase [Streptomyces sp. 3MP-14]|uniref:Adenosylcobinamide-GDP ribazoletransferase n=1 Tax=Streptomyces mimosae TaxID=2586635 RepID=A0A5N6AKM5_9ACTN|nr:MULTISPECIES: adenosylcobinamide-GDP ribazoletransferase [Streptomyces]KAB8168603.1 adenosylcobinamide-GDP ribazoletransferase [Streptomyces mimosae]KAB8178117.1 adenosylcobinamide-GDP ribazoletransferase [Streptomyces sp. 3MP-14]